MRKVRDLGHRLPLRIWLNIASDTLKGERSTETEAKLGGTIRAEHKVSEYQEPLGEKRTRATKIIKFLKTDRIITGGWNKDTHYGLV